MSATAEKIETRQELMASPQQMPASSGETALIAMIERAATNPAVDIDKMERLMKMHTDMLERNAKMAFDAALCTMQPELPVVDRRGKIVIRDKNNKETIIQSTPYALWEDINEAIRPKLKEYGFALSFRSGLSEDGRVTVTGVLSHKDGHREETMMTLQHDSTGSKNAVQAVGSSLSYGKRYTATALLNITTKGEDDDAKRAGADAVVSDEQAETLRTLITETKTDLGRFLKWAKVESIPDLQADKFDAAVAMLNAKKAPKKAEAQS